MFQTTQTIIRRLTVCSVLLANGCLADQCVLRLHVQDIDGRGVPGRFELVNEKGQTVLSSETNTQGDGQICDFGFGSYSIVIAPGRCNGTTISSVRAIPGRTQRLSAIVNSCDRDLWEPSGCSAYLRVKDQNGVSLSGVSILSPTAPQKTSDRYGRVVVPLRIGSADLVTLAKEGYVARRITFRCSERGQLEREVVLREASKH
jgi:hypothetical protein